MTAPVLDEREHAKVLAAAIKAQLGPRDVYEYGDVPGVDGNAGTQPSIYALIQVSRRFIPALHSTREASRSGWRVSVRAVGSTVNECRWATSRIALALDSQRVAIAGHLSTRIQHETSDEVTPDGDRFEALSRFTYAL